MSDNFFFHRVANLLARVKFIVLLSPFLKSCGNGSVVVSPNSIQGISNISIGENVFVASGAILASVSLSGGSSSNLHIGNRCKIGRNNHIYSVKDIFLEDGILTASNVYITDNQHQYRNHDKYVMDQPIEHLSPVRIGAGSWIGQNVCIIGASVGKGCVVGANSVVLENIPDYSVAVGAPARVIRRFDHKTQVWIRID